MEDCPLVPPLLPCAWGVGVLLTLVLVKVPDGATSAIGCRDGLGAASGEVSPRNPRSRISGAEHVVGGAGLASLVSGDATLGCCGGGDVGATAGEATMGASRGGDTDGRFGAEGAGVL